MTLVFWLLLLLLVSIISSIVLLRTQNLKESFVQDNTLTNSAKKQLDTTFGQGKCDILKSPSLSTLTQVTADSYLDTGRLKVLKNVKSTTDNQPMSTCYINNDIEKNEQDYFMSGRSCRMADFQNIPFI